MENFTLGQNFITEHERQKLLISALIQNFVCNFLISSLWYLAETIHQYKKRYPVTVQVAQNAPTTLTMNPQHQFRLLCLNLL